MEQLQILNLQVHKHTKIFLLKQMGLKNSEIAKLLETNAGHVYNALKKYDADPQLVEDAKALLT
jgi:transcriptional regulator